jgi:hypothetical protein
LKSSTNIRGYSTDQKDLDLIFEEVEAWYKHKGDEMSDDHTYGDDIIHPSTATSAGEWLWPGNNNAWNPNYNHNRDIPPDVVNLVQRVGLEKVRSLLTKELEKIQKEIEEDNDL